MSYNYKVLRGLYEARKETREENELVHAVPIRQRKGFSLQLLLVAFVLALLGAADSFAQTVIINPLAEGGFENGSTMSANGWTTVNAQKNKWFVGSQAKPTKGSNGAFISNTEGATYTADAASQVSWFYRDVTLPAGQNIIKLSFAWKYYGASNGSSTDKIQVFAVPTSFVPPTEGTLDLKSNEISPPSTTVLNSQPDYKVSTFYLPKSLAGTTFRLMFCVRSVASGLNVLAVPAAIDEISLTTKAVDAAVTTSKRDGLWSDPGTWDTGIVPYGENVVIAAGHTVSIDTSGDEQLTYDWHTARMALTNNLTVNGTLNFTSLGTGFYIGGDLVVNSGANFSAFSRANPTAAKSYKSFYVRGNITNNGQMDIFGSTMVCVSDNVQTVEGTGQFASTDAFPTTYSNLMWVNKLFLRNYNAATPNIEWKFDTRIINQLEMKGARVDMNGKAMYYGTEIPIPGAVGSYSLPSSLGTTENAGFIPGSKFVTYWAAGNTGVTINAGSIPTNTRGSYPFVNMKGENRSFHIKRAGTTGVTAGGEIDVVYNDASTVSNVNVVDPAVTGSTPLPGATITSRYDGNWVVTNHGTGNPTVTVAAMVPGVLNSLPGQTNPSARLLIGNSALGSHQLGGKFPTMAQRANLTMQQLTSGSIYVGAPDSEIVPPATITSKGSGNWKDGSTWSTGVAPSCTDIVTIAPGHVITVNTAGNVSKNVTIQGGGSLVVSGGDLKVGCTLFNNFLNNFGTLTVSGGTLAINGNSYNATGSTLIQTGGDIVIDGNDDGKFATSVASGVALMQVSALNASNLQLKGGKITFIDPHAATSGNHYVLAIDQYGEFNRADASHIVKFGNGVSTTAGGTADGFYFYTKKGSGTDNTSTYFNLGSIEVDAVTTSSFRRVSVINSTNISNGFEGNLKITSGQFLLPTSVANYFMGDIENNGEFIAADAFIKMGGIQRYNYYQAGNSGSGTNTPYTVSCPNPQRIFGTGKFKGTTGFVPMQHEGLNIIPNLAINNTSSTGVTIEVPLTIVRNATTGGTLDLTNGKLNTSATNLLTVGSPLYTGTILSGSVTSAYTSWVNGPLAKYINGTNSNTTQHGFPVGKTAIMPFSIAPAFSNTSTSSLVTVEAFESNTGTTDATCAPSSLANRRWDVTSSSPITSKNVKLAENGIVAGLIPVQSTSASGVYSAAFGPKSIYTVGIPPTIASIAAAYATGSSFSYANTPLCTGTPIPGNAYANGTVTSANVGAGEMITLTLPDLVYAAGLTYQWEGSPDNGNNYTAINGLTTATAFTTQNDAISFYRCRVTCSGNTAVSGFVKVTTPAKPTLPSTAPICSGTAATVTYSFPTGHIAARMFDAPVGGNLVFLQTNPSAFVLTTPVLTADKTFYVDVITADGLSSGRVPVTVTVVPVPSAPAAIDQNFCVTGAAPTVADLKTTTGTGVKWYNVATGGTALAATTALATGTYYVSQNPAGCESSRTAVAVTVTAPPTAVTPQVFCTSGTVADLTVTGTGITWYTAATGGIVLSLTDNLVDGRTYYASQTVAGCETGRSSVVVSFGGGVIPAVPTVNSPQPFCNTGTVGDLVPKPDATFKWYDTQVGGNPLTSTTALVDGTVYYVSQTDKGCESLRVAVTANVNRPQAPTVTSPQALCNSQTIANLTAPTANPAGTVATFKTYTTATGSTIASGTPADGATYYVSQVNTNQNSCESIARSPITVSYNNPPAVTASAQAFCGSTTVDNLVADNAAGTVKWYTTNSPTTSPTPIAPGTAITASGTYYLTQTIGGCESSTSPRNSAVITIGTTTPGVPTGSAAQTYANGATVANLTATGTAIKWYDALTGGNLLSANTLLVNGNNYYASQTVSGCESTRFTVTVTLTTVAAPTNVPALQTFCSSTTPVLIANNLVPSGSNYKWYSAPTGGSPITSASTGTYYVSEVVSGVESILRTPTDVYINTTGGSSTPSPIVSANQSFCGAPTVANLVATPTLTTGTIKWYASVTGSVLNSTDPLNNGTYYATQTFKGCESPKVGTASSVVKVTSAIPTAPTATSPQTFCSNATVSNLTVTSTVPAGAVIKWYDALTGGNLLTASTPLVNNNIYYASLTDGCESTRTAVTATVTATVAAPTAPAVQSACSGSFVSGLSVTLSGGTAKWYDNTGAAVADPTTKTVAAGTWYVSQVVSTCESAKVPVTLNVLTPTVPTVTATQLFCGAPTVANLLPNGSDIKWYNAQGAVQSPTDLLVAGGYSATRTLATCESAKSVTVTVGVNAIPATLTPSATQPFCSGKTVADLDPGTIADTATVKWYNSLTGTALATTTPLVSGNYYATQTLTGCESAKSAASAVTVNPTPATPVVSSVIQTNCTLSKGSVVLTGLPAGNWTVKNEGDSTNLASYPSDGSNPDSVVSGNTITINNLASATGSKNYKYLVTTAEGCISAKTAPININAQPLPPAAPTATPVPMACDATTTSVAFEGLPDTGNWEINPGKIVGSGTTFTLNNVAIGTYDYKVKNAAGCESAAVHVVVKVRVSPPTIGSVTQPTCAALGKVEFTGLPTTGWVISQSGTDVKTYNGSTETKEITLLATGTYRFTLTDTASGCTSLPTADVIIDAQPATPNKLVVTVTQATCAVDAVAHVSGLPAGNWTIHQKSNGVQTIDISGTGATKDVTVTAAGTYTFTVTAASGCESEQSDEVTVNAKPAGPSAPTAGTVTAATCTTFGSVVLSGLPAEGSTVTASGGVYAPAAAEGTSYTFEGLAPGTYTFTVTNGLGCVSPASAPVTIDAPALLPPPTGDAVQTFQGAATVGDLHATGAPGTAVLWYASMEDALANTGALLPNVPLENKSYYAMLTNGSCRSSAPLVVAVTVNLGVNQYNLAGLKYYPNPVNDVLTVTNTDMISSIELFNLLGQRVMTARPFAIATKIDMSDLPIGTYLLNVQSEGKTGIIKVVKD